MSDKFSGEKGPVQLESWLFQMKLYLEASSVPEDQQALIMATNLTGHTALWFQ